MDQKEISYEIGYPIKLFARNSLLSSGKVARESLLYPSKELLTALSVLLKQLVLAAAGERMSDMMGSKTHLVCPVLCCNVSTKEY